MEREAKIADLTKRVEELERQKLDMLWEELEGRVYTLEGRILAQAKLDAEIFNFIVEIPKRVEQQDKTESEA